MFFRLPPTHALRLLLLALPALLMVSCAGPFFQRAWTAAAEKTDPDPVCGRWHGTWSSRSNAHHGTLQCVVTPPDAPGEPHEFYYRATWMRILSGAYRAKHTVLPAGKNTWSLTGDHKMPSWAGGLYRYTGTLTPETFNATYDCELDSGIYRLKRVDEPSHANNKLAKTNSRP